MSEERVDIQEELQVRAILEGAQEEVPERVWEGVAAGLEQAAQGKKLALWWRRAGIAGAAAAAVVAAVLLLHPTSNQDIVSPDEGLIAVVEQTTVQESEDYMPEQKTETLIAQANDIVIPQANGALENLCSDSETNHYMVSAVDSAPVLEETIPSQKKTGPAPAETVADEEVTGFPEEWDNEEYIKAKRRTVKFVISGIAGTNGSAGSGGKSFVMGPSSPDKSPTQGIKESNTNSTYGIPLSIGAGIRFEIAPKWSIGAGLNYTFLPRKFAGSYNGQPSDIRNTQHYVGVPVNVFYDIVSNRTIDFYAYAGGTAEMCVADRYEILSTSSMHKGNPKGVQLSANLGIGVEFHIGRHLGLYIDPSVRYYFDNGLPKNIRTVQPFMPGFEVGARFRL